MVVNRSDFQPSCSADRAVCHGLSNLTLLCNLPALHYVKGNAHTRYPRLLGQRDSDASSDVVRVCSVFPSVHEEGSS